MNAAERRLSGLRNRLLASFDQKCVISTTARVPNGVGGTMEGPASTLSNVDCEVRFPGASPQTPLGQQAETTISHVEIRLPVGTLVSVTSRITVAGQTFEVLDHDTGRSYATEILCACVRVGDGA